MNSFENYFHDHVYKFLGLSLGTERKSKKNKLLKTNGDLMQVAKRKLACGFCGNLDCPQCKYIFFTQLKYTKQFELYKVLQVLRPQQKEFWKDVERFNTNRESRGKAPIPLSDLAQLAKQYFQQFSLNTFDHVGFIDIKLASILANTINEVKNPISSGTSLVFLQKDFELSSFLLYPFIDAKKKLFITLGMRTRPIKQNLTPPCSTLSTTFSTSQQQAPFSTSQQQAPFSTSSRKRSGAKKLASLSNSTQAGVAASNTTKTKQTKLKKPTYSDPRRGFTAAHYQQLSHDFAQLVVLFKNTPYEEKLLKSIFDSAKPKVLAEFNIAQTPLEQLIKDHLFNFYNALQVSSNTMHENQFIVPGSVAFREIYGGKGQRPAIYKIFLYALKLRLNKSFEAKGKLPPFPKLKDPVAAKTIPELYPSFGYLFSYSILEFDILNLKSKSTHLQYQVELQNFTTTQSRYYLEKNFQSFTPKKAIVPHLFSAIIAPTSLSLDSFFERLDVDFSAKDQYYYIKFTDLQENLLELITNILNHIQSISEDFNYQKIIHSVTFNHPFTPNKTIQITASFQKRLLKKVSDNCAYYFKGDGSTILDYYSYVEYRNSKGKKLSLFDIQIMEEKLVHVKKEVIFEALTLCYLNYVKIKFQQNNCEPGNSSKHDVVFKDIDGVSQPSNIRNVYSTSLRTFRSDDKNGLPAFKNIAKNSWHELLEFADFLIP